MSVLDAINKGKQVFPSTLGRWSMIVVRYELVINHV